MNPAGGYDPRFYSALYDAEDRHFWFGSRNRVIARVASQVAEPLPPGYLVLEIGCGNGNVTRHLQTACAGGSVIGMDLFEDGLRGARRRGVEKLVQGDAAQPPFSAKFSIVGMFDVLEHIADDRAAISHVWELLEKGGTLLITVPAFSGLWSYFDEAAGHCRRYEAEALKMRLEEVGFRVEYLTYFMLPLYPLMWLRRRLFRSKKKDATISALGELEVNSMLNESMKAILHGEELLLARRSRMPFGTSLIAVARKPY